MISALTACTFINVRARSPIATTVTVNTNTHVRVLTAQGISITGFTLSCARTHSTQNSKAYNNRVADAKAIVNLWGLSLIGSSLFIFIQTT